MNRGIPAGLVLSALVAVAPMAIASQAWAQEAKGLRVISDQTVTGFAFPDTDWNSGSLSRWSPKAGLQALASGFKGPADFSVIPDAKGLTVVVPDLVQSQLRIVRLAQ